MSSLQQQIEDRGLQIFDLVDQNPETIFSKAGFYQRMMAFSMRDEHFKVQMFRFVDVLASLRQSTDIVRHLGEYFADMRNGSVPFLQTGIKAARVFPWLTAPILRWNVSGMARQFIAGRDPEDVMKTLRKRRREKIGFTVDLLGEAVVSEHETDEYAGRCLALVEGLAAQTQGWRDPLGKNTELFPVVNVSVKISALYSQMNPADPEDAIAHLEVCTRILLENEAIVTSAFGSHNVRSIAHAQSYAEQLGIDKSRIEFQLLYGMAGPIKRALVELGYRVREYCPVGELLPGMSYLVRRLLENTSNEGFLRAKFSENASAEELLRDPHELIRRNGAKPEATTGDRQHQNAASLEAPSGDIYKNSSLVNFVYKDSQEKMRSALREVRNRFGEKHPLVIGGEKAWTDKLTPSVNPSAPKMVVGSVAEAGIPEAERAVKAARAAFEKWSRTPFEERAQLLERAAAIMEHRRYELSALEVFEIGKPWAEADGDIREAMDFCRFYAAQTRLIGQPRLTQHVPGEESYQHYWPRGVALVIAPWNFPIAILCGMVSAALVTGNTVIMKPSEQSIICGAMLMQIFEEAGVPPGVLNFLSGRGSVIGAHLVDHKDVDLIAFTGSREVGLRIWESAGITRPGQRELKRVVCEMGGKNPVIIDSDADLDEAIVDSTYSAFGYQGQIGRAS